MFPDHFYYQKSNSTTVYGKNPSGKPSVNQLIRNKDYWIQPGQAVETKPKRIVISDFAIKSYSIAKRQAMAEKLQALFDEGFEVYINTNQDPITELHSTDDFRHFINDPNTTIYTPLETPKKTQEKINLSNKEIGSLQTEGRVVITGQALITFTLIPVNLM